MRRFAHERFCRTFKSAFLPLAIASAVASGHAHAQVDVPEDFQAVEITPQLQQPTVLAFTGDGRLFIAERAGVVKVVQNGSVVSTFIDLRDEINFSPEDRGLLGMALDPNFLANRRVYLFYTVDQQFGPPEDDPDLATFSRLTRYTGTVASNGNVADPASRTVLIGATASQGMPVCSHYHVGGALRFGADGSLLIAHGDSAKANALDAGGQTPSCFTPGMFPEEQDIGAFRSQMLDSMNGKIFRVDPATGHGLPGNPYFDALNPASARSRVWVSGLRNPYRFSVRPNTGGPNHPGTLYIGDVGWNTWEEVSIATSGGENFGWPCREGMHTAANYPGVNLDDWDCTSIGSPENPGLLTDPLLDYHHFITSSGSPPGYTGVCVTAGAFHAGDSYPSPFRGGFFYADNTLGWIRVARVNHQNQLLSIHSFSVNGSGPVDFAVDPQTGNVCVLSLFSGKVTCFESLIGPGDVNKDGVVNVADLLSVITGWGPCNDPLSCPEDLDGNGQVNVADLLEVITNWG